MKIFVTGASGFVGSAVVKELLSFGHQVIGLARSEQASAKLSEMGARVYYGDLTEPDSLKSAVMAADAIVHLGFIHNFSRFKEMCALDEQVIASIGASLIGTEKPFIITSAIGILNKTGLITEQDRAENNLNPRVATERAADKLVDLGVKVSVIRLSPVVHDIDDLHGFIPSLIKLAKEKAVSAVINSGTNFWPAVHRQDVAELYRLALEKKAENGTRYHAVAEQGVLFRNIAETVARQLKMPLVSIKPEEVEAHFTWFAHFAKFNIQASSSLTQKALNWYPTKPTLLEDLQGTAYFPSI